MSVLQGVSSEDFILNPIAGRPLDSRQAKNVKTTARQASDELTFLNESPYTLPRGFTFAGRRYTNYVIGADYQYALMREYIFAESPRLFFADVKFKMSDWLVLTSGFKHPLLDRMETGDHPMLAGPMMLTQCRSKESYLQFAQVLQQKLSNLQDPETDSARRINLVTDGEDALFSAIIDTMPCVSGRYLQARICSYLYKSISRK